MLNSEPSSSAHGSVVSMAPTTPDITPRSGTEPLSTEHIAVQGDVDMKMLLIKVLGVILSLAHIAFIVAMFTGNKELANMLWDSLKMLDQNLLVGFFGFLAGNQALKSRGA